MTNDITQQTELPITSAVGNQLQSLPNLNMTKLWKLWDQHFKARPKHPNRRQLESRLTYRIQELHQGGLKSETRKLLEDVGEGLSKIKTSKRLSPALLPGTVLVREFDGIDYRVTVAIDGRFEMDGYKYGSLSAVAKHITGTQWSGPAFFGLDQGEKK
jgi:Protein of unknown function (DUF2924)